MKQGIVYDEINTLKVQFGRDMRVFVSTYFIEKPTKELLIEYSVSCSTQMKIKMIELVFAPQKKIFLENLAEIENDIRKEKSSKNHSPKFSQNRIQNIQLLTAFKEIIRIAGTDSEKCRKTIDHLQKLVNYCEKKGSVEEVFHSNFMMEFISDFFSEGQKCIISIEMFSSFTTYLFSKLNESFGTCAYKRLEGYLFCATLLLENLIFYYFVFSQNITFPVQYDYSANNNSYQNSYLDQRVREDLNILLVNVRRLPTRAVSPVRLQDTDYRSFRIKNSSRKIPSYQLLEEEEDINLANQLQQLKYGTYRIQGFELYGSPQDPIELTVEEFRVDFNKKKSPTTRVHNNSGRYYQNEFNQSKGSSSKWRNMNGNNYSKNGQSQNNKNNQNGQDRRKFSAHQENSYYKGGQQRNRFFSAKGESGDSINKYILPPEDISTQLQEEGMEKQSEPSCKSPKNKGNEKKSLKASSSSYHFQADEFTESRNLTNEILSNITFENKHELNRSDRKDSYHTAANAERKVFSGQKAYGSPKANRSKICKNTPIPGSGVLFRNPVSGNDFDFNNSQGGLRNLRSPKSTGTSGSVITSKPITIDSSDFNEITAGDFDEIPEFLNPFWNIPENLDEEDETPIPDDITEEERAKVEKAKQQKIKYREIEKNLRKKQFIVNSMALNNQASKKTKQLNVNSPPVNFQTLSNRGDVQMSFFQLETSKPTDYYSNVNSVASPDKQLHLSKQKSDILTSNSPPNKKNKKGKNKKKGGGYQSSKKKASESIANEHSSTATKGNEITSQKSNAESYKYNGKKSKKKKYKQDSIKQIVLDEIAFPSLDSGVPSQNNVDPQNAQKSSKNKRNKKNHNKRKSANHNKETGGMTNELFHKES